MVMCNPFKKYNKKFNSDYILINSQKDMRLSQQTVDKPLANIFKEEQEHLTDSLNVKEMICHDKEISSDKYNSDLERYSPAVLQNDPNDNIQNGDAPAVLVDLDKDFFRKMLNMHRVDLVAKRVHKTMQPIEDLMEMFKNNNGKLQVNKVGNVKVNKSVREDKCTDTSSRDANSSQLNKSQISGKNLNNEITSKSGKRKNRRSRRNRKNNYQVKDSANNFQENKVESEAGSSTVRSISCNSGKVKSEAESSTVRSISCNSEKVEREVESVLCNLENFPPLSKVDVPLITNDVLNLSIKSASNDLAAQATNTPYLIKYREDKKTKLINNEQAVLSRQAVELKPVKAKSYSQMAKLNKTKTDPQSQLLKIPQEKVYWKSKIVSTNEKSIYILDESTEIKRTCCFLFGVSLAAVSLINIFKPDQDLEYEVRKNGSISEYWIGKSSLCNENNYNLLKEYCRQYQINSSTKCALLELTNYVPDDCAPIPKTLDESLLVSI